MSQRSAFFEQIIKGLLHNFCENGQANQKIGCVVAASPGFVRENFRNHLREAVQKRQHPFLKDILGKMLLANCSNGYKMSLKEIISNPEVN